MVGFSVWSSLVSEIGNGIVVGFWAGFLLGCVVRIMIKVLWLKGFELGSLGMALDEV